jgi:hypothetical protein
VLGFVDQVTCGASMVSAYTHRPEGSASGEARGGGNALAILGQTISGEPMVGAYLHRGEGSDPTALKGSSSRDLMMRLLVKSGESIVSASVSSQTCIIR